MVEYIKPSYEFSDRAKFVTEPILVDGFARSGKFLLAHLVGVIDGVEPMQASVLLENILYLVRFNKLDLDTARVLIQSELDMSTLNMAIGRNLNGRLDDLSSIYKAINFEKIISRTKKPDATKLIDVFMAEDRMPLYIGHECLCNARALFEIYPSVKLINLQREPLSIIMSWYTRGWGRRFGFDSTSGSITFNNNGYPVPWFSIEGVPEYPELGEMERVVKSIEALSSMAKKEFLQLTHEQKSKIHFVLFDDILKEPNTVISGLAKYLNRSPCAGLEEILERERVPRDVNPDLQNKLFAHVIELIRPEIAESLQLLIDDFNNFWINLPLSKD